MMDENSTRAYPLYWPEGWPRTESNKIKRAQFKDRSVFTARRELESEVRKFGGRDLIISSNLELKLDGTPRSGQKQPADKGVAVFFERKNEPMALACDVYSTVEDNLWALVRTLEALRQIERDGSPALINRAFKGFMELPDPDARQWWEVLGVDKSADKEEIRKAYFRLANIHHPDKGGDALMFDQVQKAYDLATGKRGV
jgi:hypothetical protein